ncbi:MAG TPA: 3-hydroxyacyl-CoA dehydrogenase NAD-binding domain-containing protein, partial [Nitrospiria bacterium]|nr:3-hydroxyacyl-CoA dehydrogenase NAD-binding domain-containing protein [Nitrospiria bacterium]
MYIYKAAVIGAGTMGAQIAQVITYSGLPVILKDTSPDVVKKGLETIRKIYQSRVEKGKMTSGEMEQKMNLVTGATNYDDFSDVDIVIEAIYEDMEVKKNLFQELEGICPATTIFASNTSSISISAIGSAVKKPEKVVGMHFFNPAHVMKLVEVIPGIATSSETVDDVVALSESLRKIPIKVQECPGFLVNRLLMPYLNEAAIALGESDNPLKTIRDLDDLVLKTGMPMGPYALSDMIGLDISEKVSHILHEAYGPRMAPAPILPEMVKAGRLGQKNGLGFYGGDSGKEKELEKLVLEFRKRKALKTTSLSMERMIYPMINEAVMALQEGISSANDIDIAMMAGVGFPQDKGGPLHYADQIGIDKVLAGLEEFSQTLGERFWPAYLLKKMAGAGYLGVKSGKGFFNY